MGGEKMVDDLLFLAHEFLEFFEAIGFTLDVDNGTVVKDAAEDSRGDGDASISSASVCWFG